MSRSLPCVSDKQSLSETKEKSESVRFSFRQNDGGYEVTYEKFHVDFLIHF